MSHMILTNASYFLCYGGELPGLALATDSSSHRIRVLEIHSEIELEKALRRLKYLVGAFVDFNEVPNPKKTVNLLGRKTSNLFGMGSEIPAGVEEIDDPMDPDLLDRCLWRLIPNRLGELASFACTQAAQSLFPDVAWDFHVVSQTRPESFTHFGVCDSIATPFLGRNHLFFDLEKLTEKVQTPDEKVPAELVLDRMQEFVNQFLGVVTQHLVKMGYDSRVFLPQIYKGNMDFEETGPVIPMVGVANEEESVLMRIGFLNSFNAEIMNLSELELNEGDGEVDFL